MLGFHFPGKIKIVWANFNSISITNKKIRKVIGLHMLGFHFLGKMKVVLGSNWTKF